MKQARAELANGSWSDVPVTPVTQGPGHHFFGYYDKTCWDGSGRFVACLQTQFLDRPPAAHDEATVGTVDLHDGNRWRPIGRTRAWNWQQGAMLHWLPVAHASGDLARRAATPGQTAETPLLVHNDRLDPH